MNIMLWLARGLSFLWAGFWVWFGLASGIGEKLSGVGVLMHTLPGMVFLVPTVAAWKWPGVGGWVLVGMGVVIAVAYGMFPPKHLPLQAVVMTDLMLALPPLIAGGLFVAASRR